MRKSLRIALSAHRLLCTVSAVVLPAIMYGENLSVFWLMSSTKATLDFVTEDSRGGALAVQLDIQVKIFDMTIRVIHESWHTPLKRKKTWSVHGWRSSNTSNMKQVGTFLDAISHLYKRVYPSVRPSVGPSIRRSVRPSVRPSVGPSVRPSHFTF